MTDHAETKGEAVSTDDLAAANEAVRAAEAAAVAATAKEEALCAEADARGAALEAHEKAAAETAEYLALLQRGVAMHEELAAKALAKAQAAAREGARARLAASFARRHRDHLLGIPFQP